MRVTIPDLMKTAGELLDKVHGDRNKLRAKLRELAEKSETHHEAMVDFAIEELALNAVGKLTRTADRLIIDQAKSRGRASANVSRISGKAKNLAIDRAWGLAFQMPLLGSPELGDCRREQVIQGVRFYAQLSKTHTTRSLWLERIAASLPDEKKTVRDVLSSEQVKKLRVGDGPSSTAR